MYGEADTWISHPLIFQQYAQNSVPLPEKMRRLYALASLEIIRI